MDCITSKTKPVLSRNVIERLVIKAFGRKTKIDGVQPLSGGYFNAAYVLGLNSGKIKTVLKVSPQNDIPRLSYELGLMRTEVEVLHMLAKVDGVPVPEVLYADFTHQLTPNDYFFARWLPGAPWISIKSQLDSVQTGIIMEQFGRIQDQINSIRGGSFGYFAHAGQPRFNNWREAFLDMFDLLLADAQRYQAQLPLAAERIRDLVRSNAACLDEVTEPRLVYWDLWEGNVFLAKVKNDWSITGVIDSERAMWGDPLAENIFSREQIGPDFYRGYGRQISWSKTEKLRRTLYDIYLFTIMVVEDIPRQYADHKITDWARLQLKNALGKLT